MVLELKPALKQPSWLLENDSFGANPEIRKNLNAFVQL
jgi:hypothetical protein